MTSKSEIAMIGLVVFLIALALVLLGDTILAPRQPLTGVVMQMAYSPPSSSVSIHIVSDGNGGTRPVVGIISHSETWTVVLKVGDHYKTFDIAPGIYYQLSQGETITLSCKVGAIFKLAYDCRLD